MSFVRRIVTRGRIRAARRRVSRQATAMGYVALAQEYALSGALFDVVRTCEEGLSLFQGHSGLKEVLQRAKLGLQEERLIELHRELAEAPRAAVWREASEILLDSGRLARAEGLAANWLRETGDPEAQLMVARILVARFLADRGREEGLRALRALNASIESLAGDTRPWRLRLRFMSKVGAWEEARRCVEELLRLVPGEPELEARYRALESRAERSSSVDHALIQVERTGNLADEAGPGSEESVPSATDVRPALRRLAAEGDVDSAMYLRGSTAIVLGRRGATAERTARAVRTILSSGKSAGRRLGLGQVMKIQLEGEFGTLAVAPGEQAAGALLCPGRLPVARERALLSLVGTNEQEEGE